MQNSIFHQTLSNDGQIVGLTSLAKPCSTRLFAEVHKLPLEISPNLLLDDAVDWLQREKIPGDRLVLARQVHGARIRYVQQPGIYSDTDGFYSDRTELYLTIRTADCAAVMVSFPLVPAIGIVHVGWRGARASIIGHLIKAMRERWPVDPGDIRVSVSPFIRSCCYQVGPEFVELFDDRFLLHRNKKLYLDLQVIIVSQFSRLGIDKVQIALTPYCTGCSEIALYSYRKQKTARRLLNVIFIKGSKK